MTNDAYEKLGLESWCLFSVFLKITIKISIIFQKARVHDAYEKSEILESFAKHHDAYKKMSVVEETASESRIVLPTVRL